jgi:hypothetical protein
MFLPTTSLLDDTCRKARAYMSSDLRAFSLMETTFQASRCQHSLVSDQICIARANHLFELRSPHISTSGSLPAASSHRCPGPESKPVKSHLSAIETVIRSVKKCRDRFLRQVLRGCQMQPNRDPSFPKDYPFSPSWKKIKAQDLSRWLRRPGLSSALSHNEVLNCSADEAS